MCHKLPAELHHTDHNLMVEKLQHRKMHPHLQSAEDKVKNLMREGSVGSNSTINETQSELWERIRIGSDDPGPLSLQLESCWITHRQTCL